MVSPTQHFKFPPGVAFQQFADTNEGVMMSLASGYLYRCNPAACTVLAAIADGQSLAEAAHRLCNQFGIDSQLAQRDTLALVDSLSQRQLLCTA